MKTAIMIVLLLVKCTGTTLDGVPPGVETTNPDPYRHTRDTPTAAGMATLAGCAEHELECMDPTNTRPICIDPMTDPENCGACMNTCLDECFDGACWIVCECTSPCGDDTVYLLEGQPVAEAAGLCMERLDCDEHCECGCEVTP